jgi:ATP-dependent protease HslVU (ClpYQ) peptidase subunit
VTILVALRESDEVILFAADSCETESPGDLQSTYLHKLNKHESAPLVWAAAGNSSIGEAFTRRLKTKTPFPATWEALQNRAAEHLARLNGRRRRLKTLSAHAAPGDDTAEVLIAGWVDRPEIIELDDSGGITPHLARDIAAIGSGKAHAIIAYRTLTPIVQLTPLERMRWIMGVAIAMVHDCRGPIHIWRISASGVEVLHPESAS